MSYSSRSTSPDPITLPSSPLGIRSTNIQPSPRRSPNKSHTSRASNGAAQYSSPSKSFVMDTGASGNASPWRIKVTVEAEPNDGSSPPKKTRTTKVPLKGGGSSSPAKKSSTRKPKTVEGPRDAEESEGGKPQRKRKGTPIRRRSTKAAPPTETVTATEAAEDSNMILDSPSKRLLSAGRTSKVAETERSKRLSKAREERDHALQEAVGVQEITHSDARESNKDDDEAYEAQFHDDAGDMTVANEDFTMISVETLQSMKQNTSQLLENSGLELGNRSAANVSYMPSSPPVHRSSPRDVQYPDISVQASAAKDRNAYDTAPTPSFGGRSAQTRDSTNGKLSSPLVRSQATPAEHIPKAGVRNVDNAVRGATEGQAIVVEDDTEAELPQRHDVQAGEDSDIWAEEASRSLEEDREPQQQQRRYQRSTTSSTRSSQINDLFANEAPKPARSKIPHTWRRSSGVHFSYVDSPEYGVLRKPSNTSTDAETAERRSSGVLTPPSTDDEASGGKFADEDATEEGDTLLTEPDAADTHIQVMEEHNVPHRREALSPRSESSSSSASPDSEREDTGLFWQTNLPNLYQKRTRPRFQRQQRAMDLSDLLDLNKSASPAKQRALCSPNASSAPLVDKASAADARLVSRAEKSVVQSSSVDKVVSSPLRRSLLKSSKIGGSALPMTGSGPESAGLSRYQQSLLTPAITESTLSETESVHESTTETFDSRASDERQLLNEMGTASSRARLSPVQDEVDEDGESEQTISHNQADEDDYGGEDDCDETEGYPDDPTRSYEEHLNLDSPQKIKVKFNDSETNSSLLVTKKEFPPLFGGWTTTASTKPKTASPRSVTLVSKKTEITTATANQPGIFSRLSTNFWSAVVRPSGPAEILPSEQQSEPVYCNFLRRDIRSRYGVLSDQHPWTMAHMRTLHRLLNSCTSGKSDSLVPRSGPLPSALERLVGTKLVSITPGFTWSFTHQHAHVVDAFMQTLVPQHIAESIRSGEMEFLGDADAKAHRGMLAGRHGDMVVFKNNPDVKEPKGAIERAWVVKAVGNCVMANIETARKERLKVEDETRREGLNVRSGSGGSVRVQRETEESTVEDSSLGEGIVLSKVRPM